MKKVIFLLAVILSVFTARAEDVLQATPFTTTAGLTSDDAQCFSIEMNNSSAEIWALEFEMVLPSGLALDSTGGLNPFELVAERCPYKVGRGGAITWNHQVICTEISEGKYYITVTTVEAERFIGNSGELLRAYYLTDENMQPGIYPIHIKGTVLAIDGNDDIKPVESTSYFVVGDSPLKTDAEVDLTALTGYIPSWVVNSINTETAENSSLLSIDLSNADALGAVVEPANKNAVCYVKPETTCADSIGDCTAVVTGETFTCDTLKLHHGKYDFYLPQNVQGTTATYDRVFAKDVWTPVCFPFEVSESKVNMLREKGVQIGYMTSFDASVGMVSFNDIVSMNSHVPYIVKCNENMAPFAEMEIGEILATSTVTAEFSLDDAKMLGTYSTATVNSNDTQSVYVLDAATNTFVKATADTEILPLEAYIVTEADNAATTLSIVYSEEVTGIEDVAANSAKTVDVYTILGSKVKSGVSLNSATDGLEKGIYIIGNKKVAIM